IAEDRFKHDGGNLAAILANAAAQMFNVVPADDDELVEYFRNDALAGMQPRGVFIVTPFVRGVGKTDEAFVGPAVVVTFKAQNQFPSRVGSREPEGVDNDFGGLFVETHEF